MRILSTPVLGVMTIEVDAHLDARGGFARAFCAETFAAHGLADRFPHANLSWNAAAHTLRGLHYQAEPRAEAKLVRATRGRVFDVAVDLRPTSPTFRAWTAVVLEAERRNAIYIPQGCAHGYLTLERDCEVMYLVSEVYAPELARGVRWDDPAFGIVWPVEPVVLSSKDAEAPLYQSIESGLLFGRPKP